MSMSWAWAHEDSQAEDHEAFTSSSSWIFQKLKLMNISWAQAHEAAMSSSSWGCYKLKLMRLSGAQAHEAFTSSSTWGFHELRIMNSISTHFKEAGKIMGFNYLLNLSSPLPKSNWLWEGMQLIFIAQPCSQLMSTSSWFCSSRGFHELNASSWGCHDIKHMRPSRAQAHETVRSSSSWDFHELKLMRLSRA